MVYRSQRQRIQKSRRRARYRLLAAAFAATLLQGQRSSWGAELADVNAVDGLLVARGPGGRVRAGEALRGARLRIKDERGRTALVRVDDVRRDPLIPTSSLLYYQLSRYDPESRRWRAFCAPGPDGSSLAVALERRAELRFSCTSGAAGKCVRIGYRPWASAPDGRSLRPYHEACVRMLRADYCGDGTPHTRAGTPVAWIDRAGLIGEWRGRARSELRVEAVWGADGAVCVDRVRHEDLSSRDSLMARCPRLAERAPCDEQLLHRHEDALLINRS